MTRNSNAGRRDVLRLLAGGAALAAGARPASAGETRIERLIGAARAYPTISQRIDYISAALRGTRYLGYTLIGSPTRPEKFVMRVDGFDCVTYCETVLAAAIARNLGDFETVLRKIRYHNGVVQWRERNHYFFDWCQRNVENGTFRWVSMEGAVKIAKTVDSQRGLRPEHLSMTVVPSTVFLANTSQLKTGDVVGFVSHRSDLDYFHTGFAAFARDRALLLRHASESHRRVVDERMERFLARYGVRYVTVVRPLEPEA
jgi:N-acetylmuramoyl-L-alanine amidase-like